MADNIAPIEKEKKVTQKKAERLAERQERKMAREEKRDIRAEETVGKEAGRYGIDLGEAVKAPIGEEAKKRITEGIKGIASKEVATDVEGFAKAYTPPALETAPELSEEALKESARRGRRARWADALYAFGAGLRGGTADPRAMVSKRLERERDVQFQQYRDISERNKRAQALWEDKYRTDLIGFLEKRMAEEKLDKAEATKTQQAIDKLKFEKKKFRKEFGLKEEQLELKGKELEARKKGQYYAPKAAVKGKPVYTEQLETGDWQITNAKNPYSDLYFKLTGNSPVIVNELAKIAGHTVEPDGSLKRNLTEAEVERFSNTLLSRMFTVKTDEQGNRIATPIPGMENYMNDLSAKIQESNDLKAQVQKLEDEKLTETSGLKRSRLAEKEKEYDDQIDVIREQLEDSQTEMQNLLQGKTVDEDIFDEFTK
jgi:hypothetical protein